MNHSNRLAQWCCLISLLTLAGFNLRAAAAAALPAGATDITGTVEVSVADYFAEMQAETHYHVKEDATGLSYELIFTNDPPAALTTGTRARIHGQVQGGYLLPEPVAGSTTLDASAQSGVSILSVAPKLATTMVDHKVIVMLVNFTNAGISSTVSGISNIFFAGTGQSVNLAYREETFGAVSWSGKVIGPFTINADKNVCDTTGWRTLADAQATAAGENLSLYQHRAYIVPGNACGWAGLGTVGGSTGWVLLYYTDGGTICHELGHNLGMAHASTDLNNDGTIDSEYGDLSDFMGATYDWRHNDGPHKVQMGWLPSGKIVNLAMGVYQVAPLETDPDATTLPQVLKIAVPGTAESYYFSYKRAAGYDANLSSTYKDRLNIHRWSSGAKQTRFINSLADGASFTDSNVGFTIKQISHTTSSVTVSVVACGTTPVPAPWSAEDVGGVGVAGCSGYTNGVFSVTGSGADIFGAADAFQFVHQPGSGDLQLKARVLFQENIQPWAKAGVMLRDGTAASAMFADMLLTPGNGVAFEWRSATGGSAGNVNVTGLSEPVWLKLARVGNNFSGYYSTNGSAWVQVGSAQNIPMATTVEGGLAITSHTNTVLTMATFDSVSLAGQQYWDGNGAVAGAGTAPAGTWSTNVSLWSADAAGAQLATNWADGNDAVFSAGADATGAYTVTVSGTPKVHDLTIEEGTPTITGGALSFVPAAGINGGAGAVTINSLIAGNGFTKNDAGTLSLNAGTANQSNTYSGALTVNAGTLWVGNSGAAFAAAGAIRGDVQINSGGTLRLGQTNLIANSAVITVNAGGLFDLNGFPAAAGYLAGAGVVSNLATLTLDLGATAQTFSGVLAGAGGLTLRGNNGAGTQALSGANTYTGGTVVSAGTLNVFGNQSAATGGWNLPVNNATATINFQPGSTVVVANGNSIQVGSSPSSGTPNYQTLNSSGTVTNGGALLVARGGILNINSNVWVQSGVMTVSPPAGSGYGAVMTINDAGSLIYTGTNAIVVSPSGGNGGTSVLTVNGGTLTTAQGFTNPVPTSTGTASLILTGGGTVALSGTVPSLIATAGSTNVFQLGTGGGVIDTAGFSTTVNQKITDVSGQSGSLAKLGAGQLTLAASNTYSGGTTVNSGGGSLRITVATALGTGGISLSKAGTNSGTLQLALAGVNTVNNPFSGFSSTTFTGNTTVPDIENVSGTNTITSALTVTGAGGNGVAIQSDAGILTLSGPVSTTLTSRGVELNGAGAGVVSGVISDGPAAPFTVTKDGGGTWSLSGANTYSGVTTVSAGKLVVNTAQTGTGAMMVKDNASLGVIVSGAGRVSPATLTLGTGAGPVTNEFTGVFSTVTAPLNAGSLIINGPVTINVLGGAFTAGQMYPLLSYTGISGAGGFALGTVPSGVIASLGTNGNRIVLNVAATLFTVWQGSVNTNWDIAATPNWTINGVAGTYAEGSQVQFDDTAGTANVRITTAVAPGGVIVDNDSLNYTFSGSPIGGAGGLLKLGAGALTLAGSNTYAGGTVISGGTLQLNAVGAAGAGNISDNSLLSVNLAGNATLANVVSGSGALAQIGGGALTLTAVNTYSGSTTISAGGVTIGGAGQLGGGAYAGAITNNGVFIFNSSAAQTLAGTISGAGVLTQNGPGLLTLAGVNNYGGSTLINAGALRAAVSGALPATTAVNFNAATAATLDLQGSAQTVTNLIFTNNTLSSVITITGASGSALTVLQSNLLFAPFSSGTNLTVNLSGVGAFTYTNSSGPFSVANVGGGSSGAAGGTVTVTLAATNDLAAASINIGNAGGGGGTVPASILNLGVNNIFNTAGLSIGNSGSRSQGMVQFAAGLVNPLLTVAPLIGGSNLPALTVGSHDSFQASDRPVDVFDTTAGTLNAQLGSILVGRSTPNTGTNRGITITASFKMGAGTLTASSLALGTIGSKPTATNYTISLTSLFSLTNGGTANITNLVLTDNNLVPVGSLNHLTNVATIVLDGGATLNAATIQRGNAASSAVTTAQINWNDGIIGNLPGGNLNLSGVGVVLGGGTPTFAVDATGTGTVGSVISGTGALTVAGDGAVVLAATNTYTGGTTVGSGMLLVNGSISNGAVNVNSGATLGGTGTVGGAVTVAGAVAPGGSGVGTLTTGGETWNGGGSEVFGLTNATNSLGWDLLNINGALNVQANVGSPFTIQPVSLTAGNTPGLLAGFTGTNNYSWKLATATGGIQNFSPAAFAVDTAGFSNALAGVFSVATNGNSLMLIYTVTAPPAFTGPVAYSAGSFSFSFTGSAGQSYRVLASPDLAWPLTNWATLASGLFGTNAVLYQDSPVTNAQRFYRLVSP